jgi:hypothetical protein
LIFNALSRFNPQELKLLKLGTSPKAQA